MKKNKRVDLGEYIIEIDYDSDDGSLEVTILDELEGVIETLSISNDDEEDLESDNEVTPNLN
jgi:hypothetical protein